MFYNIESIVDEKRFGNCTNKKSDSSKLGSNCKVNLLQCNWPLFNKKKFFPVPNKKNDKTIPNTKSVVDTVPVLKNNMKTSGIVIKRKLDPGIKFCFCLKLLYYIKEN